jgi:hypothetical protein
MSKPLPDEIAKLLSKFEQVERGIAAPPAAEFDRDAASASSPPGPPAT